MLRFILSTIIGAMVSAAIGTWVFLIQVEAVKREQMLVCKVQAAIDDVYPCDNKCKVSKARDARLAYIEYLYVAGEWSK